MLPIEFKLADFGIAKDMNLCDKHTQLRSGTPRYMAPEQFVAQKDGGDHYKCEVFALGVTLFHLLFKIFPFAPNSYEDSNSRDFMFVENFIASSKNVNKI